MLPPLAVFERWWTWSSGDPDVRRDAGITLVDTGDRITPGARVTAGGGRPAAVACGAPTRRLAHAAWDSPSCSLPSSAARMKEAARWMDVQDDRIRAIAGSPPPAQMAT
jgi:hypothetical protein